MSAPIVTDQQILFTVDDPGRRLVALGLDCDDVVKGRRRFRRTRTGWQLRVPTPPLSRVEYKLVMTDRDGSTVVVCDPDNTERVRTAFGERSVALMPGYESPSWLSQPAEAGHQTALELENPTLGALPISVWSPGAIPTDEPARLVIVHDGPEYAELASLTHYAAVMIASGVLPTFRLALMQPVDRDAWYAANPAYTEATLAVLDLVTETFATERLPVIMGASLGGLAAVVTALDRRRRFAGVVSQSGSFFQTGLDEQESSYPFFDRVTGAVEAIVSGAATDHPLPIGLTCGVLEENYDNNEAMAAALRSLGHQVSLRDVADLHNYTAWRDSLHPTMTEVLRSAWVAPG